MQTICKIQFGSHLYGTATEKSDLDFKGVFLPSWKEILLGHIPKTSASTHNDSTRKNLPGEVDAEYYSLYHFIHLATQGQTVAIDMLFAPPTVVQKDEKHGWIWDDICFNRNKFLSKNMQAFIGYARGQASKYSLKGERLNKLRQFQSIINQPLLPACGWDSKLIDLITESYQPK